jgi:LacI family transcriptional regulator
MTPPNVALMVDPSSEWGRRVIEGVLDYMRDHGVWQLYVESRTFPAMPPRGWKGDGVIARVATPQVAEWLKKENLKVVNISGVPMEDVPFPRVTTDFEASGRLALQHFLDRGFHQFGFVGPIKHPVTKAYFENFRATLEGAGFSCSCLDLPPAFEERREWGRRMRVVQDWVLRLPRPTALLAWGGYAGRFVIDACNRAGISVPHDISVLATDNDYPLDETCHPSLSGILVPSKHIGWTAASMLDRLMQGKTLAERDVRFAPDRVIDRLSTDTFAISDPQLVQALVFIRENAHKPIGVEDILQKVPMSRRLLEHKFQRFLKRSPAAEIRKIRVRKAKLLLAETDKSMPEIAEACGFSTYNYLSFFFKKETGQSPTAYRQSVRA